LRKQNTVWKKLLSKTGEGPKSKSKFSAGAMKNKLFGNADIGGSRPSYAMTQPNQSGFFDNEVLGSARLVGSTARGTESDLQMRGK